MVPGKQPARIALLSAALLLAAPVLAARAPVAGEGGDDVITLNFQNADIRAFINTVARTTGKNFIVDPRVKGQVTITSGARMSMSFRRRLFRLMTRR